MSAMLLLLLSLSQTPPEQGVRSADVALDPWLPLPLTCNTGIPVRLNGNRIDLDGSMLGSQPAAQVLGDQAWCPGNLERAPHYCVHIAAAGNYAFYVSNSAVDAVLAVTDSEGTIVGCDDDSNGNLLPRTTQPVAAGIYYVWVGTYGINTSGNFHLVIERE